MRVLVLDSSRVLFRLVQRLVPDDVEVTYSSSFEEAMAIVERHDTDAVIADMSHGDLPWAQFQALCCRQDPQIPTLYQSSIASRIEELQLSEVGDCSSFIAKPCRPAEFKRKLAELLGIDRRSRPTRVRRKDRVGPPARA